MKPVNEGIQKTIEKVITDADSAINVGSGDVNVFGSPAMIGLMENASIQLMKPYFDEGETSVGIQMEIFHTKASPIGATVKATAILTRIEDGRKLYFDLIAEDEKGIIGTGKLVRAIIDRERFMAKMQK